MDEPGTSTETERSFLETVSFATLEDRESLPSFDSRPTGQEEGVGWEKDTLLRLEVTPLGKTEKLTIIFGPEREDGARPAVTFNTNTHERIAATEPGGAGLAIREIATSTEGGLGLGDDHDTSLATVVHSGDYIAVAQFDSERFQFGDTTNYKVDSIRSGKA